MVSVIQMLKLKQTRIAYYTVHCPQMYTAQTEVESRQLESIHQELELTQAKLSELRKATAGVSGGAGAQSAARHMKASCVYLVLKGHPFNVDKSNDRCVRRRGCTICCMKPIFVYLERYLQFT